MDHIRLSNELKERPRQHTDGSFNADLRDLRCLGCQPGTAKGGAFFRIEERELVPGQTDINPSDINQPDVDQPYDYSWTENMRRALILCSAGMGGLQEWFCDLDAGTLIRLDELTGMGEEVSAGFADKDT